MKTLQDVQAILDNISFAPSCLDLGYKFECKETADGFLIRASFTRPDSYNGGETGTGYGRWMYIQADIKTSGLVKTAWLCLELIVKHELMEGFMYKNVRIFNPHKSLTDLAHPKSIL